MGAVSLSPDDAGVLLRSRGMRSTPQRRAILSAFTGGRTEHLSADEIYARASRLLPDLSRATVYATLAEFSELALLSAFGNPEPVRYETNLAPHAHFRCRLCIRTFDLASDQRATADISDPGFSVERVELYAEGICDECNDYDLGLREGARAIIASGPSAGTLTVSGAAASTTASPLGELLLAATPQGLTRVAFEDHGDAGALRGHAASRRGSQAARRHLMDAGTSLQSYFDGELGRPTCQVDWDSLGSDARALLETEMIPYAAQRSYSDLDQGLPARDLGHVLGRNPIPILMPCHRVGRGAESPTSFVGGTVRRRWLEAHERSTPLADHPPPSPR
jgi:Fe2+ or Zn2+ uptake regulation protein/O6-methylguanine-DNA--protein-cysteine methyltransferase